MFECEVHAQNERDRIKQQPKLIKFMQNGNPERTFELQIGNKKTINKQKILKGIQKYWGTSILSLQNPLLYRSINSIHNKQVDTQDNHHFKNNNQCQYHNFNLKNLRVFSSDAVQYFDQDLLYVKNGDRLYISNGDEFDNNSNFGQYKVIRKLGQGGFGTVDLAQNIVTNEYAAIKILKTGKTSNTFDIDMIFKQAQNLKALNHPNIIKIINCYALSDMRVVIVMEYLEGGQLLGLLKKSKNKKFQQKQAKIYFKQIISGVGYCHRRGIIHRDLKLQNILIKNSIQKNGIQIKTLKIADFGISGVANRWNPEVDWGTLRYMCPEVLGGKTKTNSAAVDVWACGVILHKMVTGKYPFDGNSSSQILQAIVKKPLQFPSTILLTIKCKKLIKQMLEKDPLKRIIVPDIQDHPWINDNFTAITLPEDNWNLRTTGSCQTILNTNMTDEICNGINMNQYDIKDLKKLTKSQLAKGRTKRNFHKNVPLLERKNSRNIFNRKKSILPNHEQIDRGSVRIPRKIENIKQQIIQQLKNNKEYRDRNNGNKQKQIQNKKQKYGLKIRYNYSSQLNQRQQRNQKKLLPIINNKRNNKIISNFNFRKEVQSSFVQKV